LEPISLLSAGGRSIDAPAVRLHDARHHRSAAPATPKPTGADTDSTLQTLPAQTASLGRTLTDFTNQPLSPPLNLFNPSLGTLVSVTVMQSGTIQSFITSTNLSLDSPTIITATLTGSYQINGLNQVISIPTQTVNSAKPAGVFGSGTESVTFPPLQFTNSSTTVYSDAASLAFFTASPGRSTITPTMSAMATASASAPNGNLSTTTQTSALGGMVTLSFTYLPTPCPTTGKIGRIGVHHQRTLLILPFYGAVNPTLAGNPADYVVITRTGQKVRIISADYNSATNSVTLRTARPLNVHHRFRLSVKLPCPDDTVIIPFGRKTSLIGFHDKQGRFVTVHDGHIVRSDPRPRSRREGPVRSMPSRP
jgi:hypothetical protein